MSFRLLHKPDGAKPSATDTDTDAEGPSAQPGAEEPR